MTQRDSLLVLAGVVLASAIGALLFVGTQVADAPDARPRVFVSFAGRSAPPPRPVADAERSVPVPFRAFVPMQRNVSEGARDAAGYLLVLLGVSAALVLGRGPVLGAYRATNGGWRSQLRIFATGVAVLALVGSALFLASVVLLSTIAGGFRQAGGGIQLGLQAGFMAASGVAVLVLLAALIGYAAVAWRIGDAIFATRPFARWAPRIGSGIVAIIGATLLYVATQLPLIGGIAAVIIVVYSLGAVTAARLAAPTQAHQAQLRDQGRGDS